MVRVDFFSRVVQLDLCKEFLRAEGLASCISTRSQARMDKKKEDKETNYVAVPDFEMEDATDDVKEETDSDDEMIKVYQVNYVFPPLFSVIHKICKTKIAQLEAKKQAKKTLQRKVKTEACGHSAFVHGEVIDLS